MSSQEIILELADMVDMEMNDVADAMVFLGYRTIIHEGKSRMAARASAPVTQ